MCVAIASKIDEARPRIARTLSLEQGKPLAQATGEVAKAADGFRLASELVKQMGGQTLPAEDPSKLVITLRQPRGVYAVITPWNYPVNIPVEYLAPGIATGNTIVWVPAPTTSMAAVELMRAIESAGLPEGVINLVIGEGPTVGDEIVAHPDVNGIGFTGSAATGQRIAERGAGKPMLLELGGNGPVLVFEDADLDRAAIAAANGAFSNAGQICAATGRVLAHRSVVPALAAKIAEHAAGYILGDPLHQGTTMGPLNNPKVAAKVAEHVDDAVAAGATVVTGGKARPDLGSSMFFEPTVLTGITPTMRINKEETFGPVVPILAFDERRGSHAPRARQRIRPLRRHLHREHQPCPAFRRDHPGGHRQRQRRQHLLGDPPAVRGRLGHQERRRPARRPPHPGGHDRAQDDHHHANGR